MLRARLDARPEAGRVTAHPGRKGGRPPAGVPARGSGPDGRDAAAGPRLPFRPEREHHDDQGQGKSDQHAGHLLLDPLARSFAHAALPVAQPAPASLPPNATLVHLDQMMTRLVRKVAWGGDGRRGAARIELGAGELAGATIVVEADNGALSVDIDLPPGAAPDVWRERLTKRFKGRGFNLVELNVR